MEPVIRSRPPIHMPLGSVLQVDPSQIPGESRRRDLTWSTSLVSGHQPPGLKGPITLACWVSRVGLGGGIGSIFHEVATSTFPQSPRRRQSSPHWTITTR